MSVFAYNPESARTWANSVVNYLNGDGDSISFCSRKFSEQIERLVQPNVWTGAAAQKNYQNFMETHNTLIRFINDFGQTFETAMNSVNQSVSELEIANLGSNTNVSSTFGTLNYNQISTLSEENININEVRYDYATIISIGSELNNIQSSLESVNSNLRTKVEELNSGMSIWDGDAAAKAKEELLGTLNTNMTKIFESLNVCISNIKTAAESAQMADQA